MTNKKKEIFEEEELKITFSLYSKFLLALISLIQNNKICEKIGIYNY